MSPRRPERNRCAKAKRRGTTWDRRKQLSAGRSDVQGGAARQAVGAAGKSVFARGGRRMNLLGRTGAGRPGARVPVDTRRRRGSLDDAAPVHASSKELMQSWKPGHDASLPPAPQMTGRRARRVRRSAGSHPHPHHRRSRRPPDGLPARTRGPAAPRNSIPEPQFSQLRNGNNTHVPRDR